MAEQKSNGKNQQTPSREDIKQDVSQFITAQRQQLLNQIFIPANLIGVVSAYLLLVTAVVGFGVLAFYTGHKITQEICFYISIALLLFIPILSIWYLRPTPKGKQTKEPRKKRLLLRFIESPLGQFMSRHEGKIMFLNVTLALFQSAEAIREFPEHPRFSLTIIIYLMALSTFTIMVRLKTFTIQQLDRLLDVINKIISTQEKQSVNTSAILEIVSALLPESIEKDKLQKAKTTK